MKKLISFVAVAMVLMLGFTFISAEDALDVWVIRNTSDSENGLFGAAYGNGTYMVTKAGTGSVFVSSTGESWGDAIIPGAYDYIDVEYGNNTFVAVGYNGTIANSLDSGVSWTIRDTPTTQTLRGVAFNISTQVFMAVGNNWTSPGDNVVLISTDGGNTWTNTTVLNNSVGMIYSVASGEGKFIVLGTEGIAMSIDNGANWSYGIGETAGLSEAVYGNGIFVAAGNSGKVISTTNGINWTTETSATAEDLYSVCFGNGSFVAVGHNHVIMTSADGSTWIERSKDTSNKNYYNVVYGENTFVAVGNYDNIVQSGILSEPVLSAQSATASIASNTPVAGSDNEVILTVKDSNGNTDTSFNGIKTVTISGVTASVKGTYGSLNGTTLTSGTQAVAMTFTNGVATPNLILNNGQVQTISFNIDSVTMPNTESLIITPTFATKAELKIINNISAPSSNGAVFASQPVLAIVDEFGNTCTDDTSTVTASKKDLGNWTLNGTMTQTAVNGIVTWTDLRASNMLGIANAQLAFNTAGLAESISMTVDLPESEDPLNVWVTRNTSVSEDGLFCATYGDGLFMVTKGGTGFIFTSTDGETWSDIAIPGAYDYIDVEYGNNTFVAVGYNGIIANSSDSGDSWTIRDTSTNQVLRGIAYDFANDTFMVVGNDWTTASDNVVLVSSDRGTTWTDKTVPNISIGYIYSVASGNGKFVVLGTEGIAVTADQGATWTAGNGDTAGLNEAVYGNGKFMAVGNGGKVLSSVDGITWITETSATAEDLYSVNFGNNTYIAVGRNHVIVSSEDGSIWTERFKDTSSKNYYNVTYGENTFVAVGNYDNIVQSGILVVGADTVSATVANNTPVAGSDNSVTLTVKNNKGKTDTGFNGIKTVTISGVTASVKGTYGSLNGTTLTSGTQAVEMTFTNGVATPNLILHNGQAQTILFSINGVTIPNTASLIITPTFGIKAELRIVNNISAPSSNGAVFASQPILAIVDEFGNTCTNDTSTVTASKKDSGNWSLNGTKTQTAVNGIVTWTNLGASNTTKIMNAQLAFNTSGLIESTSVSVVLPRPAIEYTPTPTPQPTPVNPITTTSSKDGKTKTVSTSQKAETDSETGIATTDVDILIINSLVDEAQKSEGTGKKAVIEIKVVAPQNAKDIEVNIQRTAFDNLVDKTDAEVKISTELGDITFDKLSMDAIRDPSLLGDISIEIREVDASDLTEDLLNVVGDRPVYDFSVKVGTTQISNFNGGTVKINIPYTPQFGEDKDSIIVYYLSNDGQLEIMRGIYNEVTGMVSFTTNHFSIYVIEYNEVNFSDVVETTWYSTAVKFIAARSITTGTGDNNYSPNVKITRGQFITMAMRAYGINPDVNSITNFVDAGDTYYTGYLAAAKRLGIAEGIGNNLYAPENEITRQDMFTLLYNILEEINELPEVTEVVSIMFEDSDQINDWAKDAVTYFIETGIVQGDKGKVYPLASASRAEMAQILYNLLSK